MYRTFSIIYYVFNCIWRYKCLGNKEYGVLTTVPKVFSNFNIYHNFEKLPSYKNRLHNIILKLYVDNNIKINDLDCIISKLNAFNPFDLTVDYLHKFNPGDNPFNHEFSDLNTRQCIIEYIESTIDNEYKGDVIRKAIDIYKQFV